ncbi:MAG: hypothetical protein HKN45_07960 [Flavobacteriales bacterium]|nr:hypothetical protein [Flavobacteriales bacterium]
MERKLHRIVLLSLLVLGLPSCVSYLPPSSLHYDVIQNQHPIISDSLVDKSQLVYVDLLTAKSGFHHRENPEIEDNDVLGGQIGYGFADRKRSFGLGLAYSSGRMYDNEDGQYAHSNLILRGSYAFDFHDGKWNGHLLKVQGSASRGFGRYQDFLRANYEVRDEYNLAISDGQWLYSLSYGSQFYYDFNIDHSFGLGLYFNHSSDLQNDGFHSDFFHMNLEYLYKKRYRLSLGGMLDARFTPRGETIYLGLGYNHHW